VQAVACHVVHHSAGDQSYNLPHTLRSRIQRSNVSIRGCWVAGVLPMPAARPHAVDDLSCGRQLLVRWLKHWTMHAICPPQPITCLRFTTHVPRSGKLPDLAQHFCIGCTSLIPAHGTLTSSTYLVLRVLLPEGCLPAGPVCPHTTGPTHEGTEVTPPGRTVGKSESDAR
jgi:hypothetical protein